MKKTPKQFVTSLLLIGIVSCTSADTERYDLVGDFPIPKNAYDVKKLKLGICNTEELFFRVAEPYPSERVLEIYRKTLQTTDWVKCTSSADKWGFHIDGSSGKDLYVHRFIEHWVDRNDKKLLILSATYYSHTEDPKHPDNETQNIAVWIQRVGDLKSELRRLSVDCEN